MEDCYIYNRIIEAVEDNIHKEEKEIYELAATAAGLSRREAALIVKSVEGEDYNMYIKRRKIIRCAQHKVLNANEAWVDIAADYSMFEYSTFNRRFKAFLGVSPDNFPEKCRADVMQMKPSYIGKDNVIVKTETLVKRETNTVYVEKEPEVVYVKERPPMMRGSVPEIEEPIIGVNPMGEMLRKAFGILNSSVSTENKTGNRMTSSVISDTDTKELLSAYNTIIDLEEVRAIYGLTIEEVLFLYLKTGKNSEALYDKCESICDERIEELYSEEFENEPDWEEWERERFNDEFRLSEAYSYYQGEDEMEYENEEGFDNNSIRDLYY